MQLGAAGGAGVLGWAFARLVGMAADTDAWQSALVGAVAGAIWGWMIPRAPDRDRLATPWLAGVAALGLPAPVQLLRPRVAGRTFERVGLLWWGGAWSQADVATYAGLLALGALVGAICLAMNWHARGDRRLAWFAGLTTLALAAVWRTVVFPPSGDEPMLLFSAWHWLATGSLDVSHAFGEPGEVWSRAIDFRGDFAFHTVGAPGGAAYIFHGVWLPCLYGIGLWLGGRFGLALLLVGLAALTVRLVERTAGALLGKPVSPLWITAMLAGGPLAAYTVFMSADLFGGALFALGAWGLVRRKPAAVAAAAIALPYVNHKFFFTAAGLLLAQGALAPATGAVVTAAFLAGFIPEVVMIARALGLPLWPIADFLAHRAAFGASGIREFMPGVFIQAIPGLLADRYAGLIQFPAWVLALAGCWWWLRRARSKPGAAVQLAAIPYLLVLAFYNSWPGGTGTPGRMLVMVFPALALGLVALEQRLAVRWLRISLTVCVWLGVVHAHLVLFIPPLGFQSAKLKIETAIASRLGADPLTVFPGVSLEPPCVFPGWVALVWLVAIVGAWALVLNSMTKVTSRRR